MSWFQSRLCLVQSVCGSISQHFWVSELIIRSQNQPWNLLAKTHLLDKTKLEQMVDYIAEREAKFRNALARVFFNSCWAKRIFRSELPSIKLRSVASLALYKSQTPNTFIIENFRFFCEKIRFVDEKHPVLGCDRAQPRWDRTSMPPFWDLLDFCVREMGDMMYRNHQGNLPL